LLARKDEYGTYDVGILAKQNSKVLEPNHDVTVGEIRSIENLLKKYEYLFRSPLLIDIELYKKLMLGQSAKSGMQVTRTRMQSRRGAINSYIEGLGLEDASERFKQDKGARQILDTTQRSDRTWYSQ
jgi:intein/homing endonuclease